MVVPAVLAWTAVLGSREGRQGRGRGLGGRFERLQSCSNGRAGLAGLPRVLPARPTWSSQHSWHLWSPHLQQCLPGQSLSAVECAGVGMSWMGPGAARVQERRRRCIPRYATRAQAGQREKIPQRKQHGSGAASGQYQWQQHAARATRHSCNHSPATRNGGSCTSFRHGSHCLRHGMGYQQCFRGTGGEREKAARAQCLL